MRILIFVLALSGITLSLIGGEFIDTYLFSKSCIDETVNSVTANGSVFLKNSTILDSVVVNGALLSIESDLGSLQVNGEAKLEHSAIKGDALINGALKAEKCHFFGSLSIASEMTFLENATTIQILIRKTSHLNSGQILKLSGKTIIHGDIVFESGKGQVFVTDDVEIVGNVIGGCVVQK